MATFDKMGRQVPDQRQVEVPSGLGRPLSLQDEIKRFVRIELSRRAADDGAESFEEADDFDVGDDDPEEFLSPYEVTELVPEATDRDAEPPPDPKERAPAQNPATPVESAPAAGSGEAPKGA